MTDDRLRFPCPRCGWVLKSPRELVGQRAKCKNCGTEVRVPAAPPPEPLSLDDDTPPPPPTRREPPRPAPAPAVPVRWWVAVAAAAVVGAGLVAGAGGFVAGRWEVGSVRAKVIDAERQLADAKAAAGDTADRLAAAEQRVRDRTAEAADLTQAKTAAEAKLSKAVKDRADAEATAGRLKTDLDAATARAAALEGQAKSGASATGDARAAKAAQAAAEGQLAGLKAEVARLRRDLDEAEKFGPFQAFAGRWESREKTGDTATVSISIKGSGSCWAGTATPAGPGGLASFRVGGARLVSKDGRAVLDSPLMGRSWELARGPADTLTMTEVGGGRATFTLVREAEPKAK